MIKNRQLALELAKLWGSPADMRFLNYSCHQRNEFSITEKRKVLDYWDKKFNDAKLLFSNKKINLDYIKDDYMALKLIDELYFGGEGRITIN